jgi:hypothetical protein
LRRTPDLKAFSRGSFDGSSRVFLVGGGSNGRVSKAPLHLIVHNHWPEMTFVWPWLKGMQDHQFGKIYRQAASRLCVSPFMEEDYRQSYTGMRGVCPLIRRLGTPA